MKATATIHGNSYSREQPNYTMKIIQQPVSAQLCGVNEDKLRKCIDPPPVIQLMQSAPGMDEEGV
jgi:hypothetical protein